MGWGTSGWGTGAFGSSTDLTIVGAVAVATSTVRVELSTRPLASSSTIEGDALNPETWSVTREDDDSSFVVLDARPASPLIWDVTVLQPFGPVQTTHVAAAYGLRRVDGALIASPASAEFPGVLSNATATSAALAVGRRASVVDVANPPAPRGSNAFGGTLVVTAGGDYDSVSGAELVKKLIIRRFTTARGGFFHLPDYGVGLAVKEPLPVGDLVKLRTELERQARLEPEVEDASVALDFTPASGLLTLRVRARLRTTGERVETAIDLPRSTVSL